LKELIGFFGEHISAEHSSDYISFIEEFYNNAPNAYHSLDADGYFLKVNDTELKMLGYTREELIGKKRFSISKSPFSQKTLRNFIANSSKQVLPEILN
jgi:PAS domain S-box-containing protein